MKRKGFTLAELLIVIAIIAVLAAIVIPIFSGQLEKAREVTDLANIRSAYASEMMDVMNGKTAEKLTVDLTQKEDDWQTGSVQMALEGLGKVINAPSAEGKCLVYWDDTEQTAVFEFDGASYTAPVYYDSSWSDDKKIDGYFNAVKDVIGGWYEKYKPAGWGYPFGAVFGNYTYQGVTGTAQRIALDEKCYYDIPMIDKSTNEQVKVKLGESLTSLGIDKQTVFSELKAYEPSVFVGADGGFLCTVYKKSGTTKTFIFEYKDGKTATITGKEEPTYMSWNEMAYFAEHEEAALAARD